MGGKRVEEYRDGEDISICARVPHNNSYFLTIFVFPTA